MIPTRIGQVLHGGTFTGFNRIQNNVYAIFVAPKHTERRLQQKTSKRKTRNTTSLNDGWSNTTAMNTTEHPAAQHCLHLTVNDCNDWYLPSKNEMELCYRYLKPSTALSNVQNYILHPSGYKLNRPNLSSIPSVWNYDQYKPCQTDTFAFRTGSCETFNPGWYWTSTENSALCTTALTQSFLNGEQCQGNKTFVFRTRAVRREQII